MLGCVLLCNHPYSLWRLSKTADVEFESTVQKSDSPCLHDEQSMNYLETISSGMFLHSVVVPELKPQFMVWFRVLYGRPRNAGFPVSPMAVTLPTSSDPAALLAIMIQMMTMQAIAAAEAQKVRDEDQRVREETYARERKKGLAASAQQRAEELAAAATDKAERVAALDLQRLGVEGLRLVWIEADQQAKIAADIQCQRYCERLDLMRESARSLVDRHQETVDRSNRDRYQETVDRSNRAEARVQEATMRAKVRLKRAHEIMKGVLYAMPQDSNDRCTWKMLNVCL